MKSLKSVDLKKRKLEVTSTKNKEEHIENQYTSQENKKQRQKMMRVVRRRIT